MAHGQLQRQRTPTVTGLGTWLNASVGHAVSSSIPLQAVQSEATSVVKAESWKHLLVYGKSEVPVETALETDAVVPQSRSANTPDRSPALQSYTVSCAASSSNLPPVFADLVSRLGVFLGCLQSTEVR